MDNNFSGTPNNGDYSAPENNAPYNADEQYGFTQSVEPEPQQSVYGYEQPQQSAYSYEQPQQQSAYSYEQPQQQSAYSYQSAPYGTPVATTPGSNSFGLLMTFSIIETVLGCCGCGIPSIFGILGCVFSSGANKAYKNADYEGYKSKKTTTIIMLVIGLILILLTCCCGGLFGEDFTKAFMEGYNEAYYGVQGDDSGIDYDEIIDKLTSEVTILDNSETVTGELPMSEVAKFTLEGAYCEFPMPIEEFLSYGFTLDEKYETDTVSEGTYGFYSFYYQGEYYGSLAVYNPTDAEIPANEGYLSTIYITKLYDNYTPDLVMDGGLGFDSTKEDFINFYGEPSEKDEDTDSDYTTYRWDYGDYAHYLSVEFHGEELYQVNYYYARFMYE